MVIFFGYMMRACELKANVTVTFFKHSTKNQTSLQYSQINTWTSTHGKIEYQLSPRLDWILPSCGLLRYVRWFETDVSVLPIGFIFKGQDVQRKKWTLWPLTMGPIGGPETSVSNQRTPRNNPEDRRIKLMFRQQISFVSRSKLETQVCFWCHRAQWPM